MVPTNPPDSTAGEVQPPVNPQAQDVTEIDASTIYTDKPTNGGNSGLPPITRPKKTLLSQNPQAVAWGVLITGFVFFCAACVAGTFAVYWFIYESSVQLTVQLKVSRGLVTLTRPDGTNQLIRDNAEISPGTVLQTDASSQGYLEIVDGYANKVIGRVFILGNSTITLDIANRPRFDWSKRIYAIILDEAEGHFNVDIPDGLTREIVINVVSGVGTAHMEQGGSYYVDAVTPDLSLFTLTGTGYLLTPSDPKTVPATMQGILSGDTGEVVVRPYPFDMIDVQEIGPLRHTFDVSNVTGSENKLPLGWACTSEAQTATEPQGIFRQIASDHYAALQLARIDAQRLGPGKTTCQFYFARRPNGLHPNQYTSVSIRLKMKIDFQDVLTCGIVGSECPLMLMIHYVDKHGKEQEWRQGFFAVRQPSDVFVKRCDTCPHEHEQIAKETWYIYDSGDLKSQFPPEIAIDYIQYIQVYASGHQYDVSLSEVMVLGGKGDTPPPTS
jgi:hypothetical protein